MFMIFHLFMNFYFKNYCNPILVNKAFGSYKQVAVIIFIYLFSKYENSWNM